MAVGADGASSSSESSNWWGGALSSLMRGGKGGSGLGGEVTAGDELQLQSGEK